MAKGEQKLLWIDLEMSGLDIETNVIIEVAAIITEGLDFKEIETYHAVIKQDQKYIDQMDEWNKKTHGDSGLIAQIPYGKEPKLVEQELSQLCAKHFNERIVIAGNSIGHDRQFINRYMKEFAKHLHYRMLDVTSWKIVFKDFLKEEHLKKNTHRALDDIRESIAELKHYLQFVNTSL